MRRVGQIFLLYVGKFEERLDRIIEVFELPQIIVRIAHKIWAVPIENLRLQPALDLQYADYIMVAVSSSFELQVVVIGSGENQERYYDWLRN